MQRGEPLVRQGRCGRCRTSGYTILVFRPADGRPALTRCGGITPELAGAAMMAGVFTATAIRKGGTEDVDTAAVITDARAVAPSPAPSARSPSRRHRILASLDRRTT